MWSIRARYSFFILGKMSIEDTRSVSPQHYKVKLCTAEIMSSGPPMISCEEDQLFKKTKGNMLFFSKNDK